MVDVSAPALNPRTLLWWWLPVVLYMGGIFYASSLQEPPIPSNVTDTSLHEAAYFGLALLLIRALARGTWAGVTWRTLASAWLIAVIYGASDEWHQAFVPGRYAEFRDLISDAIGAFVAVVSVGAWSIIRRL